MMKKEVKKIYIFSAGSTGRDILQIINQINEKQLIWKVMGFVDNKSELVGKKINGYSIYAHHELPVSNKYYAICGHGDPKRRKLIVNKEIRSNKYILATLVHPNVVTPKDVKIKEGTIIFPGVIISYNVKIDSCVWIDANVLIGHDSVIGEYTSIFPSVTINGNAKIGKECIIGSGALITTGKRVGQNSSIGIGSIITNNISDKTTILNFPRRVKVKK